MSDESIKTPSTPNKILEFLNLYYAILVVEFNGNCLKQDKIAYAHKTIVNIYVVFEISKNFDISSYPTFENCLLEQLVWLNIMILISISNLDMVLDLTEKELLQ